MNEIRSHHFEAMVETIVCWYLVEESNHSRVQNGGSK